MLNIIIATGLIAAILLVIGFKLDDKHQVLKVLSLFFAIYCILMLGKFTLDSKEVCYREVESIYNHYSYGNNFTQSTNSQDHWSTGNVPTQQVLNSVGNVFLFHVNTTYHYHDVCYNETNSNTPKTVYTTSLWYFRIVFVYVFAFVIWIVGQHLLMLVRGKNG